MDVELEELDPELAGEVVDDNPMGLSSWGTLWPDHIQSWMSLELKLQQVSVHFGGQIRSGRARAVLEIGSSNISDTSRNLSRVECMMMAPELG